MASALQMLAGGVLLFVVGFGTGEHMTSMPGPGPLAAMAYLIIGGSLVAFSAYRLSSAQCEASAGKQLCLREPAGGGGPGGSVGGGTNHDDRSACDAHDFVRGRAGIVRARPALKSITLFLR